jgi:DNA-directed RNA polymerase subunit omega
MTAVWPLEIHLSLILRVDKRQFGVSFAIPFAVTLSIRLMTSTLLEEAFKVIPSQQLLVNVVSKRVRQLTAGHRPMVETGPRMGFSDIALTEIIQGKLTFEEAAAQELAAGKN